MTPQVPATAKWVEFRRGGGYWRLSIVCCYCHKPHWHGGGDGPAPFFGHRTTHCSGGQEMIDATRAGYDLVPA